MKLINQYKGLPKQVYILCVVRLITGLGAFIFSFTSLILTQVLDMSEVAAGYVMIGVAAGSILGAFICGKLADHYGRKRVLLLMLTTEIITLIIGGFIVYSKLVIICILMVSFCYSGILPIIAAIITDYTDVDNRKESFSLMFFCINIGYSLGQVIAGALFYDHTRFIFWVQGLLFIIATIICYLFVEDKYIPLTSKDRIIEDKASLVASSNDNKNKGFIRLVWQDKILVLFLAGISILMYCYIQISYMLPLQLTNIFDLNQASKWVSKVWFINGIFCIVWTPILLSFTKKNSQVKNVAIAAFLYAIGIGAFSLIYNPNHAWIIFICTPVWTAGEVLISTGTGVFVGGRAPEGYKARFQSLYEFSSGIGRCIGPVTMGYFLLTHTYNQGWFMVSVFCLCAVAILGIATKRENRE